MKFEWDAQKDRINFEKHGINFEEASSIFDGPVLTAQVTRREYGEDRLISIGAIAEIAAVVVIHTDRSGTTRIISARKANRKERRLYYEYLEAKSETDLSD